MSSVATLSAPWFSARDARRAVVPAALAGSALAAAAFTAVAYRTSPLVPLAAVGAFALVALAFARPLVALFVSVLFIPLELVSVGFGRVNGLTPAEVMFVLTAAGWTLQRLHAGQLPVVRSPLTVPVALLVLAVLPGLAVAADNFAVVKTLIMWTAFFLLYQLVVVDDRTSTVRRLLLALATAGGIVGAIAVSKASSVPPQELLGQGQSATNRVAASFTHPNQLAGLTAMLLPVAVALGGRGSPLLRSVAMVSVLLLLAAVLLSLSRGGFIAVSGALLVMLAWRPFRRVVIVAALAIGIMAIAGGNPLGGVSQAEIVSKRFASVTYAAQGVDPRFDVWAGTPAVIADHAVLGVGINAFSEVSLRYGLVDRGSGLPFEHAHNIPLTVAAELGLVGLAAFAWLVVALFRTLVAACRRSSEPALAFGVTAGLAALALQGLVDYTLASNFITAVAALLAACGVVLARDGRPSSAAEHR